MSARLAMEQLQRVARESGGHLVYAWATDMPGPAVQALAVVGKDSATTELVVAAFDVKGAGTVVKLPWSEAEKLTAALAAHLFRSP